MAAVDFPDSPVNGELFTNPNNGQTLQYVSGQGWIQYSSPVSTPPLSGTISNIYVGTEPINPVPGIVWFPTGPGTFGLGYIWTGGEWQVINAGKVDSGLLSDRPSAPTPGDLFFNTGTQVMEMWDGLAWIGVPTTVDASDVTFTSGTGLSSTNVKSALDEVDTKVNNLGTSLVYGGTYDAASNTLASITLAGTDAGLSVGNPLPVSAPNVFVIVTVDGTGTAPAPTVALTAGNWLINGGSSWELLQFGDPTTTANLVSYTPTGNVGSTDVQAAITELDSEKASKNVTLQAGTGLVGGGDLSANRTISLDTTTVVAGNYGGQNKSLLIEVDPQGRLTSASQVDPQAATVFQPGVVQLDNSTTSTSEVTAPTSKALKDTKDVADAGLAQANTNDAEIGSLPNLLTGNKSDLVSAINEVQLEADAAQLTANNALATGNQGVTDAATAQAKADVNEANIGNLAGLATDAKSTLVTAVNEVQTETNAAAADASQAITDAALAQATADGALPKTGGVMTGEITARNIDIQTGYAVKFANGANGLIESISDSIASTSSTTAASSLAAKTAYDKGVSAESDAAAASAKVGTLSNLVTTDKTNTVNAINELDGRIDTLGNSLIYGGTYNAAGNVIASTTQAGIDAGFTAGQPLVTGPLTENVFVIVTTAGTGAAPAPLVPLSVGNWLIGNGTGYDLLQLGTPSTTADLVAFTPTPEVSANNVQDAIDEVGSEKVDQLRQIISGTGLVGGGNLTTDRTLSLDNSGVTAGTYGNDGVYPRVEVDVYGRVINVSEISATLDGISDVSAATPSGGQVLQYNATLPGWEAATLTTTGVSNVEVNATEGNFLYVDAANGNDGTGTPGDITKPYQTIAAAVAAATAPNMIIVGEGNYAENNPINVPAGVQIISKCGTLGWVHSVVTPNDPLSDVFVLQGNKAGISGLTIETPTAANKAAIRYTGGNGTTGSATFLGLLGTAAGSGDGIVVSSTGSGKIISFEIRYTGLNMGDMMKVEGGILATESVHVPNTPLGGSPAHVFANRDTLGSPISRLQAIATNSGNSNSMHVFEAQGGTSVFYGVNWFNANNGVHITTNTYDVEIASGLIDCTTSVLVDPGLTGANGRLLISAFMSNSFDYPNTWSESDFTFEYVTKVTDNNVPAKAKVIRGADLNIGTTTKGGGLVVGRGPIHKNEMVVITSDNTASALVDGANLTNVTVEATSKDSSTFSFQGTSVNHCIYFGTEEQDANALYLKHYGLELSIITGDSRDGAYVLEIWDGTQWTAIGSQSISSDEGYSYSSDHFWRSNSKEKFFYGVRPQTIWATKTIAGFTAYFARIRIAVAPTSLPSFEQTFLIPPASLKISPEGVLTKLGGAQTAIVQAQGSNIFSENGNVTNYSFTMGDGANAYTHNINNVLLDQVGEGLYWQTAIIQGTCSALPLFVEVGYSLTSTTTTPAEFNVYLHRIRTSGSLIADPGGAILPIQRPESLTTPFTGVGAENPVLLANQPLPYQETNKLHRVRFGPFDIQDFYEGDAIALELQIASLGTPTTDVAVWGVAIIGYTWTDGIRGF